MSASNPINSLLANLSLNGDELIKWNSNGKLVPISENKLLDLTERTALYFSHLELFEKKMKIPNIFLCLDLSLLLLLNSF